MKHGKILLSLLLTLALLMSMSTFALAEEVGGETAQTPAEDAVTEEAVVEEAAHPPRPGGGLPGPEQGPGAG